MEKNSAFTTNNDPIELPPGFRFHPTDEELITHYLSPKVINTSFTTKAMGEVDLNKVEPWDLPWKARMGEKEWYFFCAKDRKYPTGLRTNRATEAGYWKATGKDREIFRAKLLVGMKKTLVFYRGRAPRGEKTNWVMHEYRLEGKNSNCNIPKTAKNEWVICRIFKKTTGGKKVHISGLVRSADDSQSSALPPLMDLSSDEDHVRTPVANTQVSKQTYLSNPMENSTHKLFDGFSLSSSSNFSPFPFTFPQVSTPNSGFTSQIISQKESLNNRDLLMMHDQSILRLMIDNNSSNTTRNDTEVSQGKSCDEVGYEGYEDQEFPSISTAQINLDWLWDYLMDC